MDEVEPKQRRTLRVRSIWLRVSAAALGTVLAIGIAEVALRLLDVTPPAVRTKTYLIGKASHFH